MGKIEYGAKGIIIKQNKVMVLVKHNGELDLPGGRVENSEGFINCLNRDVFEEVDLVFKKFELVAGWSFMKNSELRIKGETYICFYHRGSITLSQEHKDYYWAGIDELRRSQFKHSF